MDWIIECGLAPYRKGNSFNQGDLLKGRSTTVDGAGDT